MTNSSEHTNHSTDSHGSVLSYITGFVLSILLTIAAFYMVKNQVISGTTLVAIVLALALLQMAVQMIFFLHLGRGPKPLYNLVFLGATAGMIVLVVGASIFIMNSLYDHMSPEEVTLRLAQDENIAEIEGKKTGACQGNKDNHDVILGDTSTMWHVTANRCDTITFKSGDGVAHELTFATLENEPTSYGGQLEIFVRDDRAKIITLNEIGDFSFRDTNDPAIAGHFTVVEP